MNRKLALSLTAAALIWLSGETFTQKAHAQAEQPVIIQIPVIIPAPPECQPCHSYFVAAKSKAETPKTKAHRK